jgi:choline dehydrogenase-like flavoprotein
MLVEAGSSSYNDLSVTTPGKYMAQLPSTAQKWGYKSIPQKELNNREITFLFNKTLAGSSANNFMGWARGPKDDWDHWAKLVGDDSWRWDNVLPVIKGVSFFDLGLRVRTRKH